MHSPIQTYLAELHGRIADPDHGRLASYIPELAKANPQHLLHGAGGDGAAPVPAALLAQTLAENEQKILGEFKAVQGKPVDIGGYYVADPEKVDAVMRPSPTFNAAINAART